MAYHQRQYGAMPPRPRYDSYRPGQNDARNSRRPPSSPPPSPRSAALRTLENKDGRSSDGDKQRAFKKLLELARQDNLRNTRALAKNFGLLSADQQEEVIDFVYDLCEDSDESVRKHGYETIVLLSKQSLSWTRRNTDVLVQLLQSDSTEELRIIRQALISHMELDPVNAFDVMAEHCVRSGEAEVDGQQGGGLIKGLVLDFLEADPARLVREKQLTRGSDAETVFYNRMTEAIVVCNEKDVNRMLALVQALPSWTPSSPTVKPNHFLTLVLTSLLRRALSSPHDTSQRYRASTETLFFYDIARTVSKDGMGDSRVFLRFWTEVPWGTDWSAVQQSQLGGPLKVDSWLKDSMPVWDQPPADEDESMSEPKLGQKVLDALSVFLDSAAVDAVNPDMPHRAQAWGFIDEIYAPLTTLVTRSKTDNLSLKETLRAPNVTKMIKFVMTTKDQRGHGLGPDVVNKLKTIASSADSLLRKLDLPPIMPLPVSKKRAADDEHATPDATKPANSSQPARPPPVSLNRQGPIGKRKAPSKGVAELKVQGSATHHALPSRPRADMPKADARNENERPMKRQKLSPQPKSTPTPAPNLLSRLAPTGPKAAQPSQPPATLSLLDRLGLSSQQPAKAASIIHIKGAADHRADSLLARIEPAVASSNGHDVNVDDGRNRVRKSRGSRGRPRGER